MGNFADAMAVTGEYNDKLYDSFQDSLNDEWDEFEEIEEDSDEEEEAA